MTQIPGSGLRGKFAIQSSSKTLRVSIGKWERKKRETGTNTTLSVQPAGFKAVTPSELQPPPFPPGIPLHGGSRCPRGCCRGAEDVQGWETFFNPTENPMGCWSIWVGGQSQQKLQEILLDKAKLQQLHLAALSGFTAEGLQASRGKRSPSGAASSASKKIIARTSQQLTQNKLI